MTKDRIQAAHGLADLLARENEALRRFDFPAAAALLPAKEAAVTGLVLDAGSIPAEGQRADLVALGHRLNSLASENRALLERAITVQTRIVGIIVRAASPASAAGHYAANGLRSQPRRALAMALSARA